ncbi:hypothetical protein [Dokdonella soli]|uniref:Uncharacterized protein n=1 Tax=Dokdonella soli TaxID=529810 RepID=A0ABP3TQ16_9GAMM
MAAPSSDADKQRRDLYAISIGAILYNLAGGQLKPESSTLFGAVTLARPGVLLWGAAVLWAYFLWRFWLATQGAIHDLRADVDAAIYRSRTFAEFTRRRLLAVKIYLENRAQERDAGRLQLNPSESKQLREQLDELDEVLAMPHVVFDFDGQTFLSTFKSFFVVNEDRSPVANILSAGNGALDAATAAAPWLARDRWRVVARATLVALGTKRVFSDSFLPYLVAICAPLTLAARLVWHWARQ